MKALTTLVSASAIALALAATAAPSQAAVVLFASFNTGNNGANNVTWTQDGTQTGGTLATIGTAAVKFTFLGDGALADFDNISAGLTLSGTAVNTAADFDGATYTQTGISNGTFNFVYTGATTDIDGFHLVHNVTSLFSGTFNNAWIQGAGGVGGVDVTVANGGDATFTSSIYPLASVIDGTAEFTLHLATVTPNFGSVNPNTGCTVSVPITCTTLGTTSMNSFSAHAGGDFQAALPEPATWGLMLVGFGGMGALLRNRRRMAAVAA